MKTSMSLRWWSSGPQILKASPLTFDLPFLPERPRAPTAGWGGVPGDGWGRGHRTACGTSSFQVPSLRRAVPERAMASCESVVQSVAAGFGGSWGRILLPHA